MVERKYIAPNAITAANMGLGYLSIIASIEGNFIKAIWFIIVAMICDGLDGKTARKLDAFSEFGKEFDSFCDAISFGLAPGILAYSVLSKTVPSFGDKYTVAISFVYALCGVMRLVKFNIVTTASSEKDDFSGMPIPSAAAVVCSYLLFVDTVSKSMNINLYSPQVFVAMTLFAGILMVSTIPFKTPDKIFKFPKKVMPIFILVVLATLKYSMFIVTLYYVLMNIITFLIERKNEDTESTQ